MSLTGIGGRGQLITGENFPTSIRNCNDPIDDQRQYSARGLFYRLSSPYHSLYPQEKDFVKEKFQRQGKNFDSSKFNILKKFENSSETQVASLTIEYKLQSVENLVSSGDK